LRLSTAPDEAAAFPLNPPEITVLGKSVKQDVRRPLVDAVFSSADIKLSKLKDPIPLVERGLVVFT
jgi:hypothetical protein